MASWKIAGVQMDCRFADKAHNLTRIRASLAEAAARGARLVVFPECALTGYCFETKEEAAPHAETIPGPSTESLAIDCRRLGVWAVVGMLEARPADDALFNAAALIGPDGVAGVYRKIHLPFLGVDRFTTPGDSPFRVFDLDGLKIGINICYDGSFPEAARCLTLLGADLVVLPTNWPSGATRTVQHLVQCRALENHIYYMAVNRIGTEREFDFIGKSRIVDCNGDILADAGAGEEILYTDLNPERPRQKRIIHIPGKYELDRLAHRRPEMYTPLVAPK